MTPVEPIGGLRYVVENHESNAGWLEQDGLKVRRWVAKIHWNGEPHEAKQTATGMALAQAPAMLAELRKIAEVRVSTSNPNVHDSAPVMLECNVGDLRRIRALIEAATHHIEEREVD